MSAPYHQGQLLQTDRLTPRAATESTFFDNMRLPVHRWFRYSAGFSAQWAEHVIANASIGDPHNFVLDPFVGSGTTLLAAQASGAASIGIEAHPFVVRIARAKLSCRTDPDAFLAFADKVRQDAATIADDITHYPNLIRRCFSDEALGGLDRLRRAWTNLADSSPQSELVWLALVALLRPVSHAGTAPWQYVLPAKEKRKPLAPAAAYNQTVRMIYSDMIATRSQTGPEPVLLQTDARTCHGVADNTVSLVVTSPPYPNNYDYADATRLEMSFMGEISGWGDLQHSVRQHLVRSCSQHMSERSTSLYDLLSLQELAPISDQLSTICNRLAEVRLGKGGKKSYHLMVAAYFGDMAETWRALRRVCAEPASVCFVIGDSAPYGVYVPVAEWMGQLALAAGFRSWSFEKTRDRNVKWKNRKHQVPLCEGRLWVEG